MSRPYLSDQVYWTSRRMIREPGELRSEPEMSLLKWSKMLILVSWKCSGWRISENQVQNSVLQTWKRPHYELIVIVHAI